MNQIRGLRDADECRQKRGKPRGSWSPRSGGAQTKAEQEYQRAELERSLTYCRDVLGLGRQPA